MVVVGTASFKDGHHNARTIGRCTTRGDVPRQIAVDVVVPVFNVVPLLADLRIVGQRLTVLDRVVELRSLHAVVVAKGAKHSPVLGRSRFSGHAEQVNMRTRRERLDVLQAHFGSPFGTVLVSVEHDNELPWKVSLGEGRQAPHRQCEPCGCARKNGMNHAMVLQV